MNYNIKKWFRKRKKLFQELEVINRKIYEYLKLVEPLKVEIDNNL